jgi:hypothetical protein
MPGAFLSVAGRAGHKKGSRKKKRGPPAKVKGEEVQVAEALLERQARRAHELPQHSEHIRNTLGTH